MQLNVNSWLQSVLDTGLLVATLPRHWQSDDHDQLTHQDERVVGCAHSNTEGNL